MSQLLLIVMFVIGINYASAQVSNPCGLNLNETNCIEDTLLDYDCEAILGSPKCTITYKYCFGINNGQKFIYIDNTIIRPLDCPCEDKMRHYALIRIFENPNLLSYFGFELPDTEYFVDVYVANCVQKEYVPGNQGTNGLSFPGWKTVPCGNTGCCKHTYKVKYRWNCESQPCSLKVAWYNVETTTDFTNECITPCFTNCYNWTFYSGPPVEKFVSSKNIDIIFDVSQQNTFDLQNQFKEAGIEEYKGEIKIYSIEGSLLRKQLVNESFDIRKYLKESKLSNKIYLYEFISGKGINIKGKILITK